MEETDVEEPPVPSTKDWLQQTNSSLSKLKSIKKTPYQLGGGPRERDVNCHCDYRSKSKSSYLNLEADPPQISQDSQETASNSQLSVTDLLKHYHEKRASQIGKPKPRRRPYSATVCSVKDAPKQKEEEEKKRDYNYNTFIAVKGSTVNPKPRPSSGIPTSTSDAEHLYKGACLLHLDPDLEEEIQQATMEGMRKYSAYGQVEDSSSHYPPPPRASPEPPPQSPVDDDLHDDYDAHNDDDDDFFSEDDGSENSFDIAQHDMKPLVFEIPTADLEYGSDDEESHRDQPLVPISPTDDSVSFDRALSADYVAKSETFLDDLASKQTQESEELSEMFKDMEFAKGRLENIDLRSLISSPMTPGRLTTTPTGYACATPQDPSGVSVVNIGLGSETVDIPPEGSNYEALWVEEPYQPRIRGPPDFYSQPDRFHRPLRRVQSANTQRRVEENEFVLKGKNFELLDSHDLSVKGRLSDHPSRRSSDSARAARKPPEVPTASRTSKSRSADAATRSPHAKVVGKPPRPNSAKRRLSKHKGDSPTKTPVNKQDMAEESTFLPHPPSARKSSLRKSYSQGDVRCLSPEVISTVKKTVSFSDAVLEKHTRPLSVKGKGASISSDGPGSSTKIEPELLESPKVESPEQTEKDTQKQNEEHKQSDGTQSKVPNVGVIIQNGLEVKEQIVEVHPSPSESSPCGPPKAGLKKESVSQPNLIAKVKEATRCSCHEEDCHCRDITRPTRGVLCQAKAARELAEHTGNVNPKEKLLKQRPSRPSSAPIRRAAVEPLPSPPSPSRSRITSAQHKRSGSEGSRRQRPVSAHIKRPSGKDSRRNRAAVRVLKEGFLLKERPPPPLPPGAKEKKSKAGKGDANMNDVGFVWGAGEDDVAATEECEDVYFKLKEKGINVSMETIKRGLMAPARRASENCMTSLASSSSSGLLSRPEKWLPVEYARVKIWDDVLKKCK